MTISEHYSLDLNEDLSEATSFICGTEYEIEGIKSINFKGLETLYPQHLSLSDETVYWALPTIGLMRDGSLRNNGVEFITAPVNYNEALNLFKILHSALQLGPNPYTVRTSIHVHVNMRSMSLDQTKHFLLLYALLEPVFLEFAGPVRKHNIHCVPLNFTILPTIYHKSINDIIKGWSKYSALNLLPLKSLGTIEFRHLYGTGDFMVYQQWLTMIKSLWDFAFNNPPHTLETLLRSNTPVEAICQAVLPSAPKTPVDFSTSLIDVKLAF